MHLGHKDIDVTVSVEKRFEQVEKIEKQNDIAGAQVYMFPAQIPEMEGKKPFYLFSVQQVVEVLRHTDAHYVPFGPKYAEGVSEWRGRVLPMLSLESCLGVKKSDTPMPLRPIVVRTVTEKSGDLQERYAIFKVGASVIQCASSQACEPVAVPNWVTDASCVSGVYQMQERLLLVMNISKLLKT